MYKILKEIRISALLIWSALFVLSCGGDISVPKSGEIRPIMSTTNLEMTTYEGGKVSHNMKAQSVKHYEINDTVKMVFDEGIRIETYDSMGQVSSWIIAKYAEQFGTDGLWVARDSVVGKDMDGKTIYTDELFWDKRKQKIYSHVKTRVVDGDESITGLNGFESNEQLTNIEFYNSRGKILVDTDSE